MPYLSQVFSICVSFQFAVEFLPFSCISEKEILLDVKLFLFLLVL